MIGERMEGPDDGRSLEGKAVYDPNSVSYFGETAQGIFTNFKMLSIAFILTLVLRSRARPFVMKLVPRDFVFRSREFEQMEIELLY